MSPSPEKKVELCIDLIRKKRIELGLSQRALAEKTGVDHSTINLIESKKRNPSLLIVLMICEVLELNLIDSCESEVNQ